MIKTLAALCSGLLLLSCSAAHSAEVVGAHSGTRLRAWVEDAGGGAERFSSWYDTELDIDCVFYETPDGAYRCLDASFAAIYFTDADCTDPIVALAAHADPSARYVNTQIASDSCQLGSLAGTAGGGVLASLAGGITGTSRGRVSVVHTIGAAREAPAQLYVGFDDACVASAFGSLGGIPSQFAALGEEVALDRFARATRVTSPRAGGVTYAELVTDDGARQVHDVVHTSDGASCRFARIGDTWRCAPTTASAYTTWFSDDACTRMAAMVTTPAECPAATTVILGDACTGGVLHTLGAPAAAFTNDTGTCAPATFTFGSPWTIGAAVPETELDAMAPAIRLAAVGDGPLQLSTYADADGTPLAARDWQTREGNTCMRVSVGDGIVCIDAVTAFDWFADAACTEPLVADATRCGAPGPTLAYVPLGGEVHTFGDAFVGTAHQRAAAGCVEATAPAELTLRRLGDVVPTSSLPHLVRTLR